VAAVVVVAGLRWHTLAEAFGRLGRLSPWWFVAAVATETASFVVAAELHHHLLAARGLRLGRNVVVPLTYAGTAVSAVLPAGAAFSAGYTYRRLTRRGASSEVAVWALVSSGVLSTAALVVLGLAGAQLHNDWLGSAVGKLAGGLVATGALGAVGLLAWASRGPARLNRIESLVERAAALARPLIRRRDRRGMSHQAGLFEAHRDPVSMGIPGWLGASGLAAAGWMVDFCALALTFVALGFAVPWRGLLLAYVASQVAGSLPLLGCIGLAEASVTVALMCIGVRPDAALAVALVYRVVSFWITLPVGWLAWAHLGRQENRLRALEPGHASRRKGRLAAATVVAG
jgi:uncharacterized membrane protein YbhN (UPF0104 family)